jgi:hypothetical protein
VQKKWDLARLQNDITYICRNGLIKKSELATAFGQKYFFAFLTKRKTLFEYTMLMESISFIYKTMLSVSQKILQPLTIQLCTT